MKKLHLAILCGGQSFEHEVSVNSAANIARAIDLAQFDLSVIGIDKMGVWHALDVPAFLQHYGLSEVSQQKTRANNLVLQPGAHKDFIKGIAAIDVVIPVLHGPNGEDGTIQGLLKLMGIPFVGSHVLGSAVSMDKDIMKRLSRDAGLPIVDFQVFHQGDVLDFDAIVKSLGLPFFVKPCNLGSSVGVHKVHDRSEFMPALADAFRYEAKIIIEQSVVNVREIECAILGNRHPQASVVGEIIPHHEFYSYEAKYIDKNGASIVIPADLPLEISQQVQKLAIKAFECFDCAGLARVDFFIDQDLNIYFNELNTFPGFTSISMYPQLWQASGVDYSSLIEKLVELALVPV